jgi:hypothetical protein
MAILTYVGVKSQKLLKRISLIDDFLWLTDMEKWKHLVI